MDTRFIEHIVQQMSLVFQNFPPFFLTDLVLFFSNLLDKRKISFARRGPSEISVGFLFPIQEKEENRCRH
jgi:hypothetical protein